MFILTIAIAWIVLLIEATLKKCLTESIIIPLNSTYGESLNVPIDIYPSCPKEKIVSKA
jgi:hypothetical protein